MNSSCGSRFVLVAVLVLLLAITAFNIDLFTCENVRLSTKSFRKSSSSAVTNATTTNELIILVHSGAALRTQRDIQRNTCFPLYSAAGIPHYFVVGMPSFDNRSVDQHVQGQLPTPNETIVSEMLIEEHLTIGDIWVTPNRDYYRDKTEKLLGVLRFGLEQGAKYIVKTDDDYCVNVTVAKEMIRKHERDHPHSEWYAGFYYWNGTEYRIMKGPHNETAGFMSGHVFALSRGLAELIVGPDWVRNILKAAYGTSSDDANLGKMVARASKLHNVTVDVASRRDMKVIIR